MSHEKNIGNLHGVNITKDFSISHFLFIDDIFIFGRESIMEAKPLECKLILILSSIGIEVNTGNSTILLFNVHDLLKKSILRYIPYTKEDFDSCLSAWGFFIKKMTTYSGIGYGY